MQEPEQGDSEWLLQSLPVEGLLWSLALQHAQLWKLPSLLLQLLVPPSLFAWAQLPDLAASPAVEQKWRPQVLALHRLERPCAWQRHCQTLPLSRLPIQTACCWLWVSHQQQPPVPHPVMWLVTDSLEADLAPAPPSFWPRPGQHPVEHQ